MASFSLKTAHFSYTPPFNPKFKNVFLALDRWNFACLGLRDMANYLCGTFSSMIYPLARVHPLQTDRDTDDNRTISSTGIRSAKKRPWLSDIVPVAVFLHLLSVVCPLTVFLLAEGDAVALHFLLRATWPIGFSVCLSVCHVLTRCQNGVVSLVRPKTIVFGRTSVLRMMFFLSTARSPRCVFRPVWNFARWSVLGQIL